MVRLSGPLDQQCGVEVEGGVMKEGTGSNLVVHITCTHAPVCGGLLITVSLCTAGPAEALNHALEDFLPASSPAASGFRLALALHTAIR